MRIHQCHVKTGRRSCESSLTKGPSGSFAPALPIIEYDLRRYREEKRALFKTQLDPDPDEQSSSSSGITRCKAPGWAFCKRRFARFFSIAPEIIFDDGQSRLKVFCLYERRPKFTDIFSHLGAVVSLLKLRKRDTEAEVRAKAAAEAKAHARSAASQAAGTGESTEIASDAESEDVAQP
jgi:hypothetical protein